MAKHRAVIVGAGRIGAGYKWDQDLGYTHAGAYWALSDRVDLAGFIEPDMDRAQAAMKKWDVPIWFPFGDGYNDVWNEQQVDIVSICTHPEQQAEILKRVAKCPSVKGIWCEKPYVSGEWSGVPMQVNYQRRADEKHRDIAADLQGYRRKLIVYGKDDETTRCHFRDLSRWWNCPLDYRVHQGPCAYVLESVPNDLWFDGGNGGVESAKAFAGMLGNLLDVVDGKPGVELWSPPYVENK